MKKSTSLHDMNKSMLSKAQFKKQIKKNLIFRIRSLFKLTIIYSNWTVTIITSMKSWDESFLLFRLLSSCLFYLMYLGFYIHWLLEVPRLIISINSYIHFSSCCFYHWYLHVRFSFLNWHCNTLNMYFNLLNIKYTINNSIYRSIHTQESK